MHHKWKSKINRKKLRGHSTPGSTKVLSCQANHVARNIAKRSRSYKMGADYEAWYLKKIKLYHPYIVLRDRLV